MISVRVGRRCAVISLIDVNKNSWIYLGNEQKDSPQISRLMQIHALELKLRGTKIR
jgi:hypothetical protein